MKKILIVVTLLGLSSTAFADAKGELTSACSNYNSYKKNDSQGNWNGFVSNVNAAVSSNETATKAWQVANSWQTAIENKQFDGYCESDGNNSWKPIVPTTPTNPSGVAGVTKDELEASQKAQDDKQAGVDKEQDKKIDKVTEVNDKQTKDITDIKDKNKDQDKQIGVLKDDVRDVKDTNKEQSAQIKDLDKNKVDKTDQAARDSAQDDHINAVQGAAQTANDRATDLEHRADAAEGAIRETNEQLSVTDKRSQNNAVRLDGVETKNIEQDKLISQKVDTTTFKDDQERQDTVIATKASKKELVSETATRKSADAKLSSRIDSNDATLVQHDQRITSNTQRIGSVESRVSNLEQSTNKRFSDMDKRIGENRKVASAGIAGAGAMANIPQVSQNSTFSVGAGVGGYDSEQAVAVGFSARVNNNIVTKMSVSTNTQSEVLWGAGVGMEW